MSDGGVVVPKGASLRLSNLRIGWGPDGPELGPVAVELSLNMAPVWLEIAVRHVLEAEEQKRRRVQSDGNHQATASALIGEFQAGMQAIVAAATAFDAFYSHVKPFAWIPDELTNKWRVNGTARHRQVAEVLRRVFTLKPDAFGRLRGMVEEVYRFRDLAVHPPSGFSSAVQHPETGAAVEWRFVALRFDNAKVAVRLALGCIVLLSSAAPASSPEELRDACKTVLDLTAGIVGQWRDVYGALTDDEQFESGHRD